MELWIHDITQKRDHILTRMPYDQCDVHVETGALPAFVILETLINELASFWKDREGKQTMSIGSQVPSVVWFEKSELVEDVEIDMHRWEHLIGHNGHEENVTFSILYIDEENISPSSMSSDMIVILNAREHQVTRPQREIFFFFFSVTSLNEEQQWFYLGTIKRVEW